MHCRWRTLIKVPEICTDLRRSVTPWPTGYKLKRGLWNLVRVLLFRPTPKRMGNRWRLWILRRFGARIHGVPIIHASCRILQPWNLEIADGATLGHQVKIYNFADVFIGAMSVVSQYSHLCTGTHDYTHPYLPLRWKPIHIGAECWIAADVFISPGVKIGRGSVVGARSVVTKDLPEWMVCAGHPCKPIKRRILQDIVEVDSSHLHLVLVE